MGLVDQYGKPIQASQHKKAEPPKTGEAFGNWAGRDLSYLQLPGGGTIGFDLNRLTLSDFRGMRSNYQIHSSLAVLSFMQHQAEWTIECESPKIKKHVEENMAEIWTQLSRAMSTANWAGFSPNVLQWENEGSKTNLTKIKDLVPEECAVHWKEVPGWSPPNTLPPKYKVYDGIRQIGTPYPIPVQATTWYPLLMENGDYYGTKLLKPAFTPWYFSLLLHLFANRYYERFGEPTPVGRAPMDEDVEMTGQDGNATTINSREYMLTMLQNIRNRSVVVLPNDRNPEDAGVTGSGRSYDYEIEYLESQMRGADFERYMTRLDEEMSIGLFTPILLLRTADVGSYNLGQGHMQMYLWMLNALNGDRKQYIDKYILSRMVDFNFGVNAPRARIKFRKLGNDNNAIIATVIQALLNNDKAMPDLEQVGELIGMKLTEVRELTKPDPAPAPDPTGDDVTSDDDAATTAEAIKQRVAGQAQTAFSQNKWGSSFKIDMGYRKKMRHALARQGVGNEGIDVFFRRMDALATEAVNVPFGSASEFMTHFSNIMDHQLEVLNG